LATTVVVVAAAAVVVFVGAAVVVVVGGAPPPSSSIMQAGWPLTQSGQKVVDMLSGSQVEYMTQISLTGS